MHDHTVRVKNLDGWRVCVASLFYVIAVSIVNTAAVSIAHTVTIAGSTFAVAIAVGTTESGAT